MDSLKTQSLDHQFIPELLAPAGSYDKLMTVLRYGADAAYLAGEKFGLRAAADNFTEEELIQAHLVAHRMGKKLYVVLNSFLHDEDFSDLPCMIGFLKELGTDAVIVSDPGVAEKVRRYGPLPLHVSTQASVLNAYAVKAWQKLGATRVVLGRETSLEEARAIKKATGIEIEMFVHGAMCMSYSGHCVISNFTQGRDSNRGGCAHSCRFSYDIQLRESDKNKRVAKTFLSSKDLEGLSVLPQFVEAGVDSLKIEGRMKGPLYAATTTKIYRQALESLRRGKKWSEEDWKLWQSELHKLPHRGETTASLVQKAGADSVFHEREELDTGWGMAAVVLQADSTHHYILDCRQPFDATCTLEVLSQDGEVKTLSFLDIQSLDFQAIEKTRPGILLRLQTKENLSIGDVIRVFRPQGLKNPQSLRLATTL
jgi:putative protease